MICDLVRPSRQICNNTATTPPCFISVSKMNIMSRKQTVGLSKNIRKTLANSMERVPICSLLKNSIAMCVCLFGNMFTGKYKKPFLRYCKRKMEALSYIKHLKVHVGENREIKDEEKKRYSKRRLIKKQPSFEHRQKLIKNAEVKLGCLASLQCDLRAIYSELLKENLDNTPFKDVITRIQVILSRVTKFVSFAHGKLDVLNTSTLMELIMILTDFVHILKLITNVELKWNNSQMCSINCRDEESQHPHSTLHNYSTKIKYAGKENNEHIVKKNYTKELQNCKKKNNHRFSINQIGSMNRKLISRAKKNRYHCHNTSIITKNKKNSISTTDSIIKIFSDKLFFPQKNENNNYRKSKIFLSGLSKKIKLRRKNRQKSIAASKVNRNQYIQTEQFGWGDVNSGNKSNLKIVNGSMCKKRSIDLETDHSISYYRQLANTKMRIKNKLSHHHHLKTLGLTDTEIDKYRIKRIFGETITSERVKLKKPTKIKLNQITREFVKIKDTIVGLIKTNKGTKNVSNEIGPEGDITRTYKLTVRNKNQHQNLNNTQKALNQFENKLDQLNKNIYKIRTAYNCLRRISTNTLSQKAKRATVKHLISELNSITKQVNMVLLTFENTSRKRTVVSILPKNCIGKSQNVIEEKNNKSVKETFINHLKRNNGKRLSAAVETCKRGCIQWHDLHHKSVLINFNCDRISHSRLLAKSQNENCHVTIQTSNTDPTYERSQKGTQTQNEDAVLRCLKHCNECELLYQDSCFVTIGQPFKRAESVNIIGRDLNRITAKKLYSFNSDKSKEILKVGRETFEKSHKEKKKGLMNHRKKNPAWNKEIHCSRGLGASKANINTTKKLYKLNSCLKKIKQKKDKKTVNKETGFSEDKLLLKNAQTSYDSFLTKSQVMYVVEALLCDKDHCACYESQHRVKKAVKNTLAGIESAYRLALQQFTKNLNRQGIDIGINFEINSKCKSISNSVSKLNKKIFSTSPSLYKYAEIESELSLYGYRWNNKSEIYLKDQTAYLPKISVDHMAFKKKTQTGSKIMFQQFPCPLSRTQPVLNKRSAQSFQDNCLNNFMSTFGNNFNRSTLLIQNHNFR